MASSCLPLGLRCCLVGVAFMMLQQVEPYSKLYRRALENTEMTVAGPFTSYYTFKDGLGCAMKCSQAHCSSWNWDNATRLCNTSSTHVYGLGMPIMPANSTTLETFVPIGESKKFIIIEDNVDNSLTWNGAQLYCQNRSANLFYTEDMVDMKEITDMLGSLYVWVREVTPRVGSLRNHTDLYGNHVELSWYQKNDPYGDEFCVFYRRNVGYFDCSCTLSRYSNYDPYRSVCEFAP